VKNTRPKNHLFLCRPGFEETLRDECLARFELSGDTLGRAFVGFAESAKLPTINDTVFARQCMPRAMRFSGDDDNEIAKALIERIDVVIRRGNRQSGQWTLHAFAIDDDDRLSRAKGLAKAVMAHIRARQKEFYKRYISADEFAATPRRGEDLLLQIYASGADDLWFSVASVQEGVAVYEGGFQRMKSLRGAPSRSASKLEEALSVMGEHPQPGHRAVDLGAAPGGWSFVLARHGAVVSAVDHAALDQKAFKGLKGRVEHVKANGLNYMPDAPVDWMVCDMVMGAKSTLDVVKNWHKMGLMDRFVVNVKLPKDRPWPQVAETLALIEGFGWHLVRARHLIHDRSEITIIGRKLP
jgi:23S rRNA (cytidine2498-2'-O)-methyltransferase